MMYDKEVEDMTQKPRNSERGFTLIELMVILAVMGILAAVVGVGVVRVRSKREEVPGPRQAPNFSGMKIDDEQASRLCDPSDIERLQQLSPEERKATAPTYAEREDTLLYLLAALAEDEAFWKQQPASAERSERLQKLRERFDRTLAEYEMVKQYLKSNKECLETDEASRLCDPSDIERLQQLSPEERKATAPTYAERLKKAQEREDTLLYLLAALAEDEAFWKQQPASAERSERLQKLRERFDRTLAEYEMVKQYLKSNKECLALSEAGAPSPVPPPRAPTRTPPKTVPRSPSTGGVTRTPVPTQETAPTPGVEPPHMGPYDSG